MSVLITADLHFSDNPRDQYRFDFMAEIERILNEEKPDNFFILGDLTEKKDFHSAVLVNMVSTAINRLANFCPITILRGNHDGLDPQWPFYEFLDTLSDRITFIKTPQAQVFDSLGSCLFLPHTSNYKKDWARFIKEGFDDYDFIFAHNTFQGTASESGRKLDGIPTKIFPKGSTVITGDIHKPQTIKKKVTYVGSPYTVDFGDDYEPRLLLITLGDDASVIESAIESIPCTGAQKRLVEARVTSKGKLVFDAEHVNPYDVLKVRVALSAKQYADWAAYRLLVLAWGEDNCYRVNLIQPKTEAANRKRALKTDTQSARSDEQIYTDYCSHLQIDRPTAKAGLKLLQKG